MRNPILVDYHKILNCITSCKNSEQLYNCRGMVESFKKKHKKQYCRNLLSADLYEQIELNSQTSTTTTTQT